MEIRFLSPPEQEYECEACNTTFSADKIIIYHQSGKTACLDCIEVQYLFGNKEIEAK